MSGDVTAAIERLRSAVDTEGAFNTWKHDPQPDDVLAVLDEAEGLRAEREALHSGETHDRIAAALNESADAWDPEYDPTYDYRDEAAAIAEEVMQALTAGSEATQ